MSKFYNFKCYSNENSLWETTPTEIPPFLKRYAIVGTGGLGEELPRHYYEKNSTLADFRDLSVSPFHPWTLLRQDHSLHERNHHPPSRPAATRILLPRPLIYRVCPDTPESSPVFSPPSYSPISSPLQEEIQKFPPFSAHFEDRFPLEPEVPDSSPVSSPLTEEAHLSSSVIPPILLGGNHTKRNNFPRPPSRADSISSGVHRRILNSPSSFAPEEFCQSLAEFSYFVAYTLL